MGIKRFYWNEYERRECSKWGKTALDVFAEMNMSETNVQAKRAFKVGKMGIRENERELWEEEIVLLELIQAI